MKENNCKPDEILKIWEKKSIQAVKSKKEKKIFDYSVYSRKK